MAATGQQNLWHSLVVLLFFECQSRKAFKVLEIVDSRLDPNQNNPPPRHSVCELSYLLLPQDVFVSSFI